MKDQRPQYPASLFWTGVALSILRSFLWLIISTVLLLVGRTTPWCGAAGLAILALVVAVALIKQLSYRHTVLHSKDSEFADWQAAMLSPDWEENVKDMVQRAMNDEIKGLKKEIESYKAKEAAGAVDQMLAGAETVGAVKVLTKVVPNSDPGKLRQLGDVLRDKDAAVVAVLATQVGEKLTILAVCGKDAVKAGVKAGDIVT